jgi:serine/threonine-protein kinase
MDAPDTSVDNEVPPRDDPLVGQVVDNRFRIDSLLGKGTFGRVYTATQLSVDREVAFKVLRGDFRYDATFRKRFAREAKVISEFNHPNIVRLLDYGNDRQRDFAYIVMEMIQGVELGDLLSAGRLAPPFALEVLYQVAAALLEAHRANVVHRDLSTDNIILVPLSTGRFQTKVFDFGVAYVANQSGDRLTADGRAFGTPSYMSPEHVTPSEICPASDLYSLGVVLHRMLTGQVPFSGESDMKTLMHHVEHRPPTLSESLGMEFPDDLERLHSELLAKTPDGRPGDAATVRERIDQIRRNHDWPDRFRIDPDAPLDELFDEWLLPKYAPPESTGSQPRTAHSTDDFSTTRPESNPAPPEPNTHADKAPPIPDSDPRASQADGETAALPVDAPQTDPDDPAPHGRSTSDATEPVDPTAPVDLITDWRLLAGAAAVLPAAGLLVWTALSPAGDNDAPTDAPKAKAAGSTPTAGSEDDSALVIEPDDEADPDDNGTAPDPTSIGEESTDDSNDSPPPEHESTDDAPADESDPPSGVATNEAAGDDQPTTESDDPTTTAERPDPAGSDSPDPSPTDRPADEPERREPAGADDPSPSNPAATGTDSPDDPPPAGTRTGPDESTAGTDPPPDDSSSSDGAESGDDVDDQELEESMEWLEEGP